MFNIFVEIYSEFTFKLSPLSISALFSFNYLTISSCSKFTKVTKMLPYKEVLKSLW